MYDLASLKHGGLHDGCLEHQQPAVLSIGWCTVMMRAQSKFTKPPVWGYPSKGGLTLGCPMVTQCECPSALCGKAHVMLRTCHAGI